MKTEIWRDGHSDCYMGSPPHVVTTVSELRVNNLIIQKALVLTAKGDSAEAKQVTFPPS